MGGYETNTDASQGWGPRGPPPSPPHPGGYQAERGKNFVFGYVYELELPSRDPAFDSDVLFELPESRATVALEEPIVARNL